MCTRKYLDFSPSRSRTHTNHAWTCKLALLTLFKSSIFIFRLRDEEYGGKKWGLEKKFPAVNIMIGSVVLRFFFPSFFPLPKSSSHSGSLVRLSRLLTQAKAFSGICSCIHALQVPCRLPAHLPPAMPAENLTPGAASPARVPIATPPALAVTLRGRGEKNKKRSAGNNWCCSQDCTNWDKTRMVLDSSSFHNCFAQNIFW